MALLRLSPPRSRPARPPRRGRCRCSPRKHHRHKKHHHKHRRHHSTPSGTHVAAARSTPAPPAAGPVRSPSDSRAAVNAAYWRSYAPGLNVPTGYSGDESRCIAGGVSGASLTATRNAINFVRSLGGLAPVSFNSALNARSQQTALMMSANRTLSHSPSRSWRCYTSTGAANAGRSNLALAYPKITSAGVVGLYMQDPGGSNYGVGHRRWLLNPFATSMGSGSTNVANAITVIGPSSSARPNPTFVSWPTAGYFPNTIEPSGAGRSRPATVASASPGRPWRSTATATASPPRSSASRTATHSPRWPSTSRPARPAAVPTPSWSAGSSAGSHWYSLHLPRVDVHAQPLSEHPGHHSTTTERTPIDQPVSSRGDRPIAFPGAHSPSGNDRTGCHPDRGSCR